MTIIVIPAEKTETGEYMTAAHFGRCPFFVIATIEDNVITKKEVKKNPHYEAHIPFAVPDFLGSITPKPDIVITSGLGPRAVNALSSKNMEVITGIQGKVDEILDKYIHKTLIYGKNICEHL